MSVHPIKKLLRDDVAKWKLDAGDWMGYCEELIEEVEKLRAELAEMTEAYEFQEKTYPELRAELAACKAFSRRQADSEIDVIREARELRAELKKYKTAIDAIKTSSSKGEMRRIAIQAGGQER